MSTPTRIAGFVAGLVAAFAAALLVGALVGPVGQPASAHQDAAGHEEAVHDEAAGHEGAGTADLPGGLLNAQDGYRLDLAGTTAPAGTDRPLSFVVTGPDGEPVTAYEVEHEQELHLIAVRRDLTGFQHVHPVRADDGTWTTGLDLVPGQWRVFADFVAAGAEPMVLGADLSVAGTVPAAADLPERRTAEVDGYTVTLDGDLHAGETSDLVLSVSRDGEPVTDLEPYLGAYGHLVALREGDLAYLHVHPEGEPGDGSTEPGPQVGFGVEVPSDGGYQLYLDFRHDGVVRTAQLALDTVPHTEEGS